MNRLAELLEHEEASPVILAACAGFAVGISLAWRWSR